MHFIKLHNGIHKIMEAYHRLGFWHRRDEATIKQMLIKIVYSIYYLMFPISFISGAMVSDNNNEAMLLIEAAIITTVTEMRLFYIIWRQKEISELLRRIGVYSIKEKEDLIVVDNKLNNFIKWIGYFYAYTCLNYFGFAFILPFIGDDKKLFFNIGFPLDYQNNDFAFWIAHIFIVSETGIALISVSFTIIIWYLLFNCGLRYRVLGSELRNIGVIRTVDAAVKKRKIAIVEEQNVFKRDLIAGIKSHKDINGLTEELGSFFYELFSVQLATSAAGICASIYILAFNSFENIMEWQIHVYILFYNLCDIFMLMYYGNEIRISSDELSYSLFESNWMEQSQSCKMIVIIFGERLKQAQQLVILKIYPLTLETFTRIMNGAYSMFNILKTMAQ